MIASFLQLLHSLTVLMTGYNLSTMKLICGLAPHIISVYFHRHRTIPTVSQRRLSTHGEDHEKASDQESQIC